jgi:hypothetical protein
VGGTRLRSAPHKVPQTALAAAPRPFRRENARRTPSSGTLAPVAHRPRFTKNGVAPGRCRCPTPRHPGTAGLSSPSAKARTNSARASDAVRSSSVAGLRSHRQSSEIQRYGVAVKQLSRAAGRVRFPSASQMAASTPAPGGRCLGTPTHLLPIGSSLGGGTRRRPGADKPAAILPSASASDVCARSPKAWLRAGLEAGYFWPSCLGSQALTGTRALARASPRLSNSGAVWMTLFGCDAGIHVRTSLPPRHVLSWARGERRTSVYH